MTKVLYILGAGASANVLPIINSFYDENDRLHQGLKEELLIFTKELNHFSEYKIYYDLCNESTAYATPDTFSKFLFITNRDSDYRRFKIIISAYFFWKERINPNNDDCLDKRVISFLTTLSDNNGSFPENIKIINWNYDSQFTRAIDKAKQSLPNNSFLPNFNIFPFSHARSVPKTKASLIQLNGIAGYSFDQKESKISNKSVFKEDIFKEMESDGYRVKKIIDILSNPIDKLLISYAWEINSDSTREYQYANDSIECAKALSSGAEILVVIGYSFPFFNRDIDKQIFKEMPGLKKIYYQDPYLNGQFLYSQFNLIKSMVGIEHIPNVKNYYVPYEL